MNLFAFIKSQLSILDVVGSYATLKKAGLYWKGHCPFHSERTGSFTVSPHKEIFYCFGCHVSGDIISFIEKTENCSALEAARFLVDRYHLNVPSSISYESPTQDKKQYFELCELVARWCHNKLLKTAHVTTYLEKRCINTKNAAYFTLGYFPGGLHAVKYFIQDMARYNILVDDLIAAHILVKGKNVLYSPFEERILFPIKDHLGRFCGFGGRTFKSNDTRAKYYNTREHDYFSKGTLLFGLDLAKKEIQKKEHVFLVEGYTDCIAMVHNGYTNTVATLGTACTAQHLTLLGRYAQELFLIYDGDKAGQQALLRIAQLCWDATIELKVISLPAHEDPASFLEKGDDLSLYIEQAQDIFVFFINSLGTAFSSKPLSEKMKLTRQIVDVVQKIDDPLKRDFLLQKASKTLEVPLQSLKQELNQPKNSSFSKKTTEIAPEPEKSQKTREACTLEKKIFCAIINNIQLFNKKNHSHYLITFLPEPLRAILKKLKEMLDAHDPTDFVQFFDSLNKEQQVFTSKILLENESAIGQEAFEQLLLQLQKKYWKVIVNNIKIKIEHAKDNGNEQQVQKLLHEFLELRQKVINTQVYQTRHKDIK